MDDSDQDFADLCSRLLKRVRRKGGESAEEKRTGGNDSDARPQIHGTASTAAAAASAQVKEPSTRKRRNKDAETDSRRKLDGTSQQPLCPTVRCSQTAVNGAVSTGEVENGTVALAVAGSGANDTGEAKLGVKEVKLGVKEKVLSRMQQFKRVSPQKLLHAASSQPTVTEQERDSIPLPQHQEPLEDAEGDEALALRLQQQLDREAQAQGQVVDLEQRGLFFCQLCQRDLSAMSPQLRTQHINRCLDQSEDRAPLAPPRPRVPECPICGKGFKSQKSRSAHLKRCSADMGVHPAMLLQALQRQAAEAVSDSTTSQPPQARGSKRKGPSDPSLPARKKPRKKARPLDEDTMVAMALSRSLLEKEKEKDREMKRERVMESETEAQLTAPPAAVEPVLQWRPAAGKGRGKRRKGAPPPLLLVQDPQTVQSHLQERVSSLLLRQRPPSPPTPTLHPCCLPAWMGGAPLWLKSVLPGGGPDGVSEFYTPELSAFIQPWAAAAKDELKSSVVSPIKTSSVPSADTPVVVCSPAPCAVERPGLSQSAPSPCTPTLGTQAMQDVLELAEEGMTLTQWGYTAPPATDREASAADLHPSGFVPVVTETKRPRPASQASVAVSRLASDLSSMVNNPQLSDVQLQVDCGDVFFAHSFMLYARCPLLAHMVHASGFGVQEEGMPTVQRALLGEVPAGAVRALLQYLYTGHCPLTHTLLPHVLELAARFDLAELQQLCQLHPAETEPGPAPGAEAWGRCPAQEPGAGEEQEEDQPEHNFLELLRSMWNQEDGEEEGEDGSGGGREEERAEEEGGGEPEEERVDEDEMEEIYEFAATQRKMESVRETGTESGEEEEEEEEVEEVEEVLVQTAEGQMDKQRIERGLCVSQIQQSASGAGDCPTSANARHHSDCTELKCPDAAMVTNPIEPDKISPDTEEPEAGLASESEARPSPQRDADGCLDRSYSRLFSQSWGDYVEPSQCPASCSQRQGAQAEAPAPGVGNTRAPRDFRLQSSASEVIDLSVSPPLPPGASSLPVPGLSPEAMGGEGVQEQSRRSLKRESRGSSHSAAAPCSPAARPGRQPELIVLSDSGEEMDADPPAAASPPDSPARLSPSPPPPGYTGIRPRLRPSPQSPAPAGRGASCSQGSPDEIPSNPEPPGSEPSPLDGSPLDGSAEVSWLVPATPVPPTRAGSTQTYSSMRRTQLFPKSRSSSSSSRTSEHGVQTDSTSFRAGSSSARLHSTSLAFHDDGSSHKRTVAFGLDGTDVPNQRSPVFLIPAHHPRLSRITSLTPSDPPCPRGGPQPSSSTPLHSDASLRLHNPPTSPLRSDPEQRLHSSGAHRGSGSSGSPGRRGLGSLRRTLTDASPRTSSGAGEGGSGSPAPRRPSTESRYFQSPESAREAEGHERESVEVTSTTGEEEGERVEEEGERRTEAEDDKKRDTTRVEQEERSFAQQSFCGLDEPPMPFDDSWGLAGGAGGPAPRFSLRLESSGDADPPEPRGDGRTAAPLSPSPPRPDPRSAPLPSTVLNASLFDSKIWDDWEEEREALPLSQRVATVAPAQRVAQLKTPVASRERGHAPLVPITPMPGYSDMDTPELKNKLNRFGVRPLPKKQMVLKLKQIHQYTHQLMSSDSEGEVSMPGRPRPLSQPARLPSTSCVRPLGFKEPRAPPALSPRKPSGDAPEPMSASQGSSTSSTADESDRSNPELCLSEDDSEGEGVTASQAAVRGEDKLQAVRHFITSDPELYGRVLRYQPLVLAHLQARLRAAGIRLGAAKLLDFLDSQCITFTTAKPGQAAPSRRRGRGAAGGPPRAGRGRRKAAAKD